MMANQQYPHYWFKRRRYGWGWYPVTWQGWASVIVYVVIVLGTHRLVPSLGLPVLVVATVLLIGVCARKGPSPRWRWGSSPQDDPDLDA